MRLYQSVGPNPRVVTMFIAEKGITIERRMMDLMEGENRSPEALERNPRGGSPVLELEDGGHLTESTAICEYLEERYPDPPLVGATPEERAFTRAKMRVIDQSVIVPMSNGFRSAEGLPMFKDRLLCVPEAAEGNKAYARDGLAALDRDLGGGGWLCGEHFTLADIMLFCFTDFGAQVGQPLADELANLKAWHERVAARPSAVTSANPKNGL